MRFHAQQLKENSPQRQVKHDHNTTPTPPTKTVGGGGRISREICRFFALRAINWRRGVKSPRKMQVLMSSSGHWAGGVLRSEVPRLVAILKPSYFANISTVGKVLP